MRQFLVAIAAVILCVGTAHAQCFFGCGDPVDITGDEVTLSTADSSADQSLGDIDNQAQGIYQDEETNLQPGEAGGFDESQALVGDLEQQVSSTGGMSLNANSISAYQNYWPGYSNAGYLQGPPPPGSPEGNLATTLGTLHGALQAGADQQQSQGAEQARLEDLESKAGNASGNLQVQEVSNEIALFNAQEEMKQRNATNATLNALLVAESNRQNQKAQDDLESLTVTGATFAGDFTQETNPPEPKLPVP